MEVVPYLEAPYTSTRALLALVNHHLLGGKAQTAPLVGTIDWSPSEKAIHQKRNQFRGSDAVYVLVGFRL